MHQHPRPSPRAASSANSPRTNPTRTNNPREMPHIRSESGSTATSYATARSDTGSDYIEKASDGGEPDYYGETEEERTIKKLNQVIMQFFKKATLTVLSARTQLPQVFNTRGELRQSKWFSLLLDETDVYNEDLREWTTTDLVGSPPPPLCIEIYLDTKDLTDGEALAIVDEHGKLWDVAEALNASTPLTTRPSSRSGRPTQVVLERWSIEVTENQKMDAESIRMILPNVYKNGIALFRSLYTYTRFLPAWKYYRHIAKQPVTQPSLPLRYRISNGMFKSPRRDTLDLPLYPAAESVAQTHVFDPVKSPIGQLSISVQYRSNTEFRVEKSESVLSSHFMGMDDYSFSPSYPERESSRVPGSLPTGRDNQPERLGRGEAYGSLSTFHQVGTGTSPISALRNAKDMGSPESPPQKIPPNHRTATGSKPSLRGPDAPPSSPRRSSVSFQPANPFKAGSLSSSPVPGVYSPGTSLGKTPSSGHAPLGHTRNRSSLNALPQTALRTPSGQSLPNETAIASSASSSPKPAPISRYSSSFGNRRSRFSSGGAASKTEDDNNSSGKGSASSSAQRLEGGSSGSVQTDEDNISDFLKLLEQKKDLKSLNRTDSASRDASMRRTTAALSKYQRMRESNAALSDSISSSLLLHRSSSSSSRHLSNVPGMIGGASVSTSSSPGKPISPHTPHTPAIPSRLSANSIIDYSEPHSRSPRDRRREDDSARRDTGSDSTSREREGTTAIDIPTSPRPWPYIRRSSSVSQQHRSTLEEENELFGLRSASLPTEDRGDLSMSELLHIGAQEPTTPADAEPDVPREGQDSAPDPEPSPQTVMNPLAGHMRTRSAGAARAATASPSLAYRTRIQPSGPSDGRRSAASERGDSDSGITSGRSSRVGSRYSFSSRPLSVAANLDDDEPLLFTMSELGAQGGRRSVEEMRESASKRGTGRGASPWRGA